MPAGAVLVYTPKIEKTGSLLFPLRRGYYFACKFAKDSKSRPRSGNRQPAAAWENFALPATREPVVHGMQGFDYDRARTALKVPHGFQVEERRQQI